MQPVSEQDARRAWLSGQERRNRFVGATHVRCETHSCSPDSLLDRGSLAVRSLCDAAKSRRNRGALRGLQVFGDGDERVRSQQNDVLAPAAEEPRSSQELMSRLTVYSVVPVISAMS